MEFSAAQLASIIGGEVVGDPSAIISTYSKIEEAKKGALTFLANKKIIKEKHKKIPSKFVYLRKKQ